MIGRAIASPDSAQAMKISTAMCRSSVVSLNPGSAVAAHLQRGDIVSLPDAVVNRGMLTGDER